MSLVGKLEERMSQWYKVNALTTRSYPFTIAIDPATQRNNLESGFISVAALQGAGKTATQQATWLQDITVANHKALHGEYTALNKDDIPYLSTLVTYVGPNPIASAFVKLGSAQLNRNVARENADNAKAAIDAFFNGVNTSLVLSGIADESLLGGDKTGNPNAAVVDINKTQEENYIKSLIEGKPIYNLIYDPTTDPRLVVDPIFTASPPVTDPTATDNKILTFKDKQGKSIFAKEKQAKPIFADVK